MSRELPARPNLEHLKNQARAHLAALRRANPEAQFADALHVTAREYGFATWPVLKEHVESIRGEAGVPSPFDGLWKVNAAKSAEPLLQICEAAMLRFAVGAEAVTIEEIVHERSGQERHRTYTVPTDGAGHAIDHGYMLAAEWHSPRRLELEVSKEGQHVSRVWYAVSDDGRELTLRAVAATHDGYPAIEQTTLFDRG